MKKMIEYQTLDAKCIALEKQVESSKEHDILNKMGAVYKDMQSKLIQLEEQAKQLNKEYEDAYVLYEKNMEKAKKLSSANLDKQDEESLKKDLDDANKISSDLFMLERKLNQILVSINTCLKDFELAKKQGLQARSTYAKAKESLETLKAKIAPQTAEIAKQCKVLESGLDKTLFTKYKAHIKDGIFPVFVPMKDNRCGYCRVEIPMAKVNSLTDKDVIVCEQCRRFIYKA